MASQHNPQITAQRPGIESSPVCDPKETSLEFNTSKGVHSVAAVAALLKWHGHQVKIMPTSGEPSPYDLLVGEKHRVEVKVCARRTDGFWFFNIHRHGILDESSVDAYILRLEQVPEFKCALHLVIPAPIKRSTVTISLRSLITRYARYYNRFDYIGRSSWQELGDQLGLKG